MRTLLLWILLTAFFSPLAQATQADSEYLQKRKIIAHILKTVSWPPKAIVDHSLNVCVMGQFTSEASLDALHGTTINNQKILVRKTPRIENAKKNCQFIYISKSETARIQPLINTFSRRPVLLLGDMDAFAQAGGSMNFTLLNKTLALTINTESLKKSNLTLKLNAFDEVTIFPDEDALKI